MKNQEEKMKNIFKIAILICLVAALWMMASCNAVSPQDQTQNPSQEESPKQETTPISENTTAPHEHKITILASTEPTCSKDGLTAGEQCADCGKILKAQEVVPATEHTTVFIPAKETTCTEWGYSACWLCSVCGETFSEDGENIEVEFFSPQHRFVNNVCTQCPSILSEEGFILTLNEDGKSYTLSDFIADESKTEIFIPDLYNDLPITAIGNMAFQNCQQITSIRLPDTLTSIGEIAFDNCINLSIIIIPNGVTVIQDGAFMRCEKLFNVIVPDSVTNIGTSTFLLCENLTNITYQGTCEQWNAILKKLDWFDANRHYTIHCTDGDIRE